MASALTGGVLDTQRGLRHRWRAPAATLPAIHRLPGRCGHRHERPAGLARAGGPRRHERGEIGGDELLGRIAAMARRPLDGAELRERWLDMFDRAHDMFDLAAGLKTDTACSCCRTSVICTGAPECRYGFDDLAHGVVASFRVGAIKPSAAIYRERNAASDSIRPRPCSSMTCRRTWRGTGLRLQAIHHRDPGADAPAAARARRAPARAVRGEVNHAGHPGQHPALVLSNVFNDLRVVCAPEEPERQPLVRRRAGELGHRVLRIHAAGAANRIGYTRK